MTAILLNELTREPPPPPPPLLRGGQSRVVPLKVKRKKKKEKRCQCDLQPSHLSPSYLVQISFHLNIATDMGDCESPCLRTQAGLNHKTWFYMR